jgi:predicted aspartyl protease
MKNKPLKVFIILIVIILIEITVFYTWEAHKKAKIREEYELKIKVIEVKKEQEKRKLRNNFEQSKYLASGKNVYERIYNQQGQRIITLILRLAKEAFPEDWKIDLRVEEFTNFILLIQPKTGRDKPSLNHVTKHIIPVVRYAHPYLKNIAGFDKNHKCYLYFDENMLEYLNKFDVLSSIAIDEIKRRGNAFTKFNSISIDFQQIEGHIFIPVIVGGVYECLMMLDTGASMTVISKESVERTTYEGENLSKLETRTFSTAKGLMTCPIIKRNISIAGIDRKLLVAINVNDELNLLGVDFFKDYDYTINSGDSCIYIWNK